MDALEMDHDTVPMEDLSSWIRVKDDSFFGATNLGQSLDSGLVSDEIKPGEFVMRNLFSEFAILAEKKIDLVLSTEALEKPLSKSLQRGEDAIFDQLLAAFGSVAENCLPSLLRTLFAWYERQLSATAELLDEQSVKTSASDSQSKATGKNVVDATEKGEQLYTLEKRDLAVEFIFCLVLIEVLKQLPLHPGHEDLIGYLENLAFKHFKFREGVQQDPNIQNINIISDLYAEVVGVMVLARFHSVKKRFNSELKELRSKEPSPVVTHGIISLLMGMKFFRIKMAPIEEFEASFTFMHECAAFFLEAKDKDIKHALAGLFVEILVPVAAVVKNEVNVPCLKNFVEQMYPPTLDLCTKKKHMLALFPLVTCLLCVSQKSFFLQNWHYFLVMCLSHLKNRDPKMSRVALESLYRLLWVYMIRIKCESNSATQSRLQSIVNSLFPKGSKAVVPRDTPLNIFVKIIQFIAQERLDFAMKEIVFDLLSVGRPIKIILTPERMSIGLRAFLVVADSLQQKDGEPPMPRTVAPLPSGNTVRVKKTFLNKMLTDEMARSIGMNHYHPYVKKALNDMLRALDVQFGRPLMMTTIQNINKEPGDMITGERKPKIDLFRTCVAAIPRLIPDGMSRQDLVDLLSRLTVHMDEEMRGLACQALQNLVNDFPDWREDVTNGFMHFVLQEVNDTFPQLLDNSLRMLLQILSNWKQALHNPNAQSKACNEPSLDVVSEKLDHTCLLLHRVEGFALVMLCSCRQPARRLAAHILKEARYLLKALSSGKGDEPAADIFDKVCPSVVESCLDYIAANERALLTASSFNVDLQWLAERSGSCWVWEAREETDLASATSATSTTQDSSKEELRPNAWLACLMGFMGEVERACPTAVSHAWSVVCQRLNALFTQLDTNPIYDSRASALLRVGGTASVAKKTPNEKDIYLYQWKSYLMFTCKIAPTSYYLPHYRGYGFDISSSPDSVTGSERSCENRSPQSRGPSPANLFKQILPLIRSEQADLRGAAVLGLSFVNSLAIKDMMEELVSYIREAIDRKQENMRRRKRRELLRVQLGRLLELIAEKNTFGSNQSVIDRDAGSLNNTFVEYIDGIRLSLETEVDKELASSTQEIKLNFCSFVTKLVKSFKLESRSNLLGRDLRRNLFYLFAHWTGKIAGCALSNKRTYLDQDFVPTSPELSALEAMSSVLCCGPVFDLHCLSEDSNIYRWLEILLASKDTKISLLGQETLVFLLEHNPDSGALLDWLVDCCYTKSVQIADSCFSALSMIFCLREYPCDHYVAIINVTLMNVGSPRAVIHQLAVRLLQVLDYRFFESKANSVLTLHHEDTVVENTDESGDDLETGVDEDEVDVVERIQLRSKRAAIQLDSKKCQHETFQPLMTGLFPCNQIALARRMAQLHPQLTMPIFSEVTFRLQTARPPVCQNLLDCLVPWLYNMELVDPHVAPQNNPTSLPFNPLSSETGDELPHEGWGSGEATEMVLNNLLYITVKFGDEYPKEIEDVWASLSSCWPNNLRIIIRYLFILTGLAPTELLPHTKRVSLFMAHSKPDRFIDEIMTELQTVESLNCVIERTETPPFFRITNIRKGSGHSEEDGTSAGGVSNADAGHGTLHTKRHSTESGEKGTGAGAGNGPGETGSMSLSGSSRTSSTVYSRADKAPSLSLREVTEPQRCTLTLPLSDDVIHHHHETFVCSLNARFDAIALDEEIKREHPATTPQPHPLPMPEFGGYYAPLTEFLPSSSQAVVGFHRCNLALMLLCDVVISRVEIDWQPHIPTMLHVIFLGLDHPKTMIQDHCKELLLNLLIVCGEHKDDVAVTRIVFQNECNQLGYKLPGQSTLDQVINFTEPPNCNLKGLQVSSSGNSRQNSLGRGKNSLLTLFFARMKHERPGEEKMSELVGDIGSERPPMTTELLVKHLIDFLSSRQGVSLWNCEDITARVWTIRSAEQMSYFLEHVLHVFASAFPTGHVQDRWAEVAIQLALSCSSRHLAGRSLQIFRSLKMPINSRMLSDILSRLIETVAVQGEDMQGYVTELMLTLEAAVDSLDSEQRFMSEFVKELLKTTPSSNISNISNRKSAPPISFSRNISMEFNQPSSLPNANFISQHRSNQNQNQNHVRSTSYSIALPGKRTFEAGHDPRELRFRSSTDTDVKLNSNMANNNLARSRSVQSLKLLEEQMFTPEDRTLLLSQFFWIAVAMLETDYEHEFLLAVRLLDKTLCKLALEKNDSQKKVDKIMAQTRWSNFPGIHHLLLKGCTSSVTYEATTSLLHKLTPLLEIAVIDPSESAASFPFNVMALLPYMLSNYDDPNALCIHAAENFAQWCTEKSKKLDNLATVMTLYSKRSFSKESFQWTKCVIKYLYDAYSHVFLNLITFMVEVMDKGPLYIAPHAMSALHCIFIYMDITSPHPGINKDLNKVVLKYIESAQWKDALKIIKLVVTRSSTLAAAPVHPSTTTTANATPTPSNYGSLASGFGGPLASSDCISISSGRSSCFAESEMFGSKRELPGRTMEFTFDLTQTPIVGRRYLNQPPAVLLNEHGEEIVDDLEQMEKGEEKELQISSPRRSFSCGQSFNESGNWKKPWLSQSRTRERLIALLTTFGQRVGLPKSPSVIFSQNSDIVDRQSSIASSTEDVSPTNNDASADSKLEDNAPGEFGMFKDFDFLEYELESQEGESMDNFNWGVRRRSLSNLGDTPDELTPYSPTQGLVRGRRCSQKEREGEDASSDEEAGSVSHLGDTPDDLTPYSPTRGMGMVRESESPRQKEDMDGDGSSDDEDVGTRSVSPSIEGVDVDVDEHAILVQSALFREQNKNRAGSVLSRSSTHSMASDGDPATLSN